MAQLYDDSGSESDGDAAGGFGGKGFAVNKAFAEKYEAKKRTEELSKLQDKYGASMTLSDAEDDDSEDLSDDDSDAELVTPQVDVAILRTLAKIRNKAPEVYEEGREVFTEEELRTAATATTSKGKKAKDSKPVLLKEYQRNRLLADPTGDAPGPSSSAFLPTFAQEERALKAEVTKAFHAGSDDEGASDDGEDDLLVPRTKTKAERDKEDKEYEKFLKDNAGDREVEDALEQEEQFLREYILNRGWIDKNASKFRIPSYNEVTDGRTPSPEPSEKPKKEKKAKKEKKPVEGAVLGDEVEADKPAVGEIEDDSDFEEKADEFEHKYNFRFEEEAGPTILTHSRDLSTSVRRPAATTTARARARQSRTEREEEEKTQRKEEVRRLKALKRKEVEEKLLKIIEAAGEGTQREALEEIDLEGDWDPEEHDRRMAKLYGDSYGEVDDAEFKPTWDDDIDISDLPNYSDDDDEAAPAVDPSASTSAPAKAKKDKKGKRKRDEEGFPVDLLEAAKHGADDARKQLIDKMTDEYYGLEYEDKIGDMPTRFNYAKVEPSAFALTPAEILLATDAELNAYMSLRKIAPYRSSESKEAKASKKKLKELKDALKDREWGVEVDEEVVKEKRERKERWREEGNAKKRQKLEGGAEVGESAAKGPGGKRVGKKERQRRKAAAEAEAAGGTTA